MVTPQTTAECQPQNACSHVDQPSQPPILQCGLSRYAGGNHISFLYKVFMFCWWCTATELAPWRNQDVQGPLQHFYCQDCCDNYITGGANLETAFPSAFELVAVFPFGSLGIGGGVKNTLPCTGVLLLPQSQSGECVSCYYLPWKGNSKPIYM